MAHINRKRSAPVEPVEPVKKSFKDILRESGPYFKERENEDEMDDFIEWEAYIRNLNITGKLCQLKARIYFRRLRCQRC